MRETDLYNTYDSLSSYYTIYFKHNNPENLYLVCYRDDKCSTNKKCIISDNFQEMSVMGYYYPEKINEETHTISRQKKKYRIVQRLVSGLDGNRDLDNYVIIFFPQILAQLFSLLYELAPFSEYFSLLGQGSLEPISLECPEVNRKERAYLFPVTEAIFRLVFVGLNHMSIPTLSMRLRNAVLKRATGSCSHRLYLWSRWRQFYLNYTGLMREKYFSK